MYVKTVSRFRKRKVIAPLTFICRGALSKSFTWSPVHTNVGLKGWSRNLRNVKLCFEDLQDYQGQPFVIASARGIKAVGIGIRKDKYERAADDLQLLCREPWRQHS